MQVLGISPIHSDTPFTVAQVVGTYATTRDRVPVDGGRSAQDLIYPLLFPAAMDERPLVSVRSTVQIH